MKTLTSATETHLAQEVTTLTTCWKMTRRDSTVMGFTSHDRDIVVDSVTYKAASGFTPTAIASSSALNVDNLDLEGMLTDQSITEADIMAGLYDFAEIEIFMVNYAAPEDGQVMLRRGWLGEVSFSGNHFIAEVRGLTQALTQTVGELFSPSCRASLGDSRCGVDLASHTVTGNVTSTASSQEFVDSTRDEVSGIFTGGVVSFTSGANDGLSMEVKEYILQAGSGGRVILAMPMPYAIAASDSYSLVKGCDKTLATCRDRFANVANFRGEPHVPGMDRILETAGTRSDW